MDTQEGDTAAPRTQAARDGLTSCGKEDAPHQETGTARALRSGGLAYRRRPRQKEEQEVTAPYAAHHKCYRVGSIFP